MNLFTKVDEEKIYASLLKNLNCHKKFGDILSLKFIEEGVVNKNYIFNTDTGSFFLKNYSNNNSESRILYINDVEKFMSINNIPAINAIFVDEFNKYSVYPFIESDRSHSYDFNDYKLMGKMLANIHCISFNKEIPKMFKDFSYKNNISKDNLLHVENYLDIIKNKKIKEEIDFIYKEYLEKKLFYAKNFKNNNDLVNNTIMHGDFHPGNLFFDKKTRQIIGVCDWERAEYGPRAYDLAKAFLNISFGSGEEDIELCFKIKDSLLEGYRSILPISDDEFKKGILMRINTYLSSNTLEDKYFIDKDIRSNRFVKNWIRILDTFCTGEIF